MQKSGARICWIRSTRAATCHPAIDPLSPHDPSLDEADILERGLDPRVGVGGHRTGGAAIVEEQDIVYRDAAKAGDPLPPGKQAPQSARAAMLKTRDLFGFWQGLLRVVGSFGDCPRCLAVCPVGNDYHMHLAEQQKHIPEKTQEKISLQDKFKKDRKSGAAIPGLSEWNVRWVGEEGYKGIVARQLQEFKKRQNEVS